MYNRAPWHKELLSEQNTKFILKESPCVITCILYNVESTCDLSENYSRPKLNPKQAPTTSPFTVFIWNLNQKTAMCDTIIIVEVSAYQISSHPEDHSYYHRQDHKWPPFKHMAPTWTESPHGCIRELHLTSMQCSYILNSVRFRTDSNSVWKKIFKSSIKFSEPNWIRFGNKKTYLSPEKIPNRIQFGLEKKL